MKEVLPIQKYVKNAKCLTLLSRIGLKYLKIINKMMSNTTFRHFATRPRLNKKQYKINKEDLKTLTKFDVINNEKVNSFLCKFIVHPVF